MNVVSLPSSTNKVHTSVMNMMKESKCFKTEGELATPCDDIADSGTDTKTNSCSEDTSSDLKEIAANSLETANSSNASNSNESLGEQCSESSGVTDSEPLSPDTSRTAREKRELFKSLKD